MVQYRNRGVAKCRYVEMPVGAFTLAVVFTGSITSVRHSGAGETQAGRQ
jgi:hypothetical protein